MISSTFNRYQLPAVNLSTALSTGKQIVGASSHAVATVQAIASIADSSIVIGSPFGGSFQPGEVLHLGSPGGTTIGQVGADRERPTSVGVSHSGKLSGVSSFLSRRVDGIHYVVMVNQSTTRSSFYLKNHSPSTIDINTAINNIVSSLGWPSWDLF